jgi:hypothetical protein
MKKFSDKRILKQLSDNPLKKGTSGIHPLTLEIVSNEENVDVIATQLHLGKDIFEIYTPKTNKNIIKSRNDIDNMQYPDLSLPLTDYINIYDIDTDEELFSSLKNMVNKNALEDTIFRIVNLYVRIKFKELKKINNLLIKIFKIIFKNKKLENDEFINEFIKKWFENNNEDDFKLNICNDFKNYLG